MNSDAAGRRFAVVGAGMQGVAAAYDLGRQGAVAVLLADYSLERAADAASRVNELLGRPIAEARAVDATDPAAVAALVAGCDGTLSAVPYRMHPTVHEGAREARSACVDLGSDTPDAQALVAEGPALANEGLVRVVDAGLAPGLVNLLAVGLLEGVPDGGDVRLYCGGLPPVARPPMLHTVRFSIEGLVGEYADPVLVLRDGAVVEEVALQGLETVEVPGVGTFEAATTSGGTSLAPYWLRDRVRNYEYKTLRHPGHWGLMRFLMDAGLFSEEPVTVGGAEVVPARVVEAVIGPKMQDSAMEDIVIGIALVESAGVRRQAVLRDRRDATTGFGAMERTTGFSAAIVLAAAAAGRIAPGAYTMDQALPASHVVAALRERGMDLEFGGDLSAADR